jgi:DNA-binding transcriptional MerR regulator
MVGRGEELSPGEVATRLGVAHSTVIRWEDSGDLVPCRRLPSGHRRYDPADVDALDEVLAITDPGAREQALVELRKRNLTKHGRS